MSNIRRGQMWHCNLPKAGAHEQAGSRPVIIVSNNVTNETSSVILVIPCTRQVKRNFPTHTMFVSDGDVSIALAEQLTKIDVSCLTTYMGYIDNFVMERVDQSLRVALGLVSTPYERDITEGKARCSHDR